MVRNLITAMILVATAGFGGAALAECQPGQMQEANLAYQSAQEFLAKRQWDQAIARMQSIIQVCPEHVEATRGIGLAMMGKQDFESAAPYFSQVIVLRKDQVQAPDYANLAKCYTKMKMYKEARAEYMKAEQLSPDDCGVLFNLGVLNGAAGYHTQSVDAYEHALDQCPQYRENILPNLSKAAAKAAEQQKLSGNVEKAKFYEQLAAEYGGQAGGATTYDMVKKHMTAKEYNQAIALLEQMLAKNPDQPNAWLTLARASDAAGDKSRSIQAYREYLAIKPNNTTAHGAMIQVMVEAGKCTEAKADAAKAYSLHQSKGREGLAPILYSWGLALECLGDYEAAKSKFLECASSGSDRYASSARTQVERMDGLMAREAAEKKKAAQGG